MKKVLALAMCLVMLVCVTVGCSGGNDSKPQGRYIYSINESTKMVMDYNGEDVKFLNESSADESLNSTIITGTFKVDDSEITIYQDGDKYAVYTYDLEKDVVVAPASGMTFTKEQ